MDAKAKGTEAAWLMFGAMVSGKNAVVAATPGAIAMTDPLGAGVSAAGHRSACIRQVA